jgi:hypothetical protein
MEMEGGTMPETTLLHQLPNGGAVIAIIVVTWFYLSALKELLSLFLAEISAARKEYKEGMTQIMQMGLAAHEETRAAIRDLRALQSLPVKKP